MMEKREYLLIIDFGFWYNSKKNDHKHMTFSVDVYISIFYTP